MYTSLPRGTKILENNIEHGMLRLAGWESDCAQTLVRRFLHIPGRHAGVCIYIFTTRVGSCAKILHFLYKYIARKLRGMQGCLLESCFAPEAQLCSFSHFAPFPTGSHPLISLIRLETCPAGRPANNAMGMKLPRKKGRMSRRNF